MYLKRSGGQLQYSEPLRFQTRASGRLVDMPGWILDHIAENLSNERLATQAKLSLRQFMRLFRSTFGASPAEYVERLRMSEAAERLAGSAVQIETLAASLGYPVADTFRRAFERRFAISPSQYRQRFRG